MPCSLEPLPRYSGSANLQSKVQGQATVERLSDPAITPCIRTSPTALGGWLPVLF
jgi:hypothetical protein